MAKKKEEKQASQFVKLTKKDGCPVWINASYVVTVEPSRTGGAIVVPIGDGLDYDVREEPENVLAMIAGAPVPPAVPVPVPPPESLAVSDTTPPKAAAEEPPKKRRAVRKAKAEPAPEPERATVAAESVADALSAEAERNADADTDDVPEKLAERRHAARGKFEFPDEYLARLRKLAPRSVRKFDNTLRSQFKIEDPEPVLLYLVDRGLVSVDGPHIVWRDEASAAVSRDGVNMVFE